MKKILCLLCIGLCLTLLIACGHTPEQITIVAPQGEGAAAAETLQQAFRSQWGKEYKIATAEGGLGGGTQILMEVAAQEGDQSLREQDFHIEFAKSRIVVTAGSPEALSKAAGFFAQNYLDYYEEPYLLPQDPTLSQTVYGPYPLQQLTIEGVDIGRYSVVTPGGQETPAAAYLQLMIEQATGHQLPLLAPDAVSEDQPVLVLGSSGYGQSRELTAGLGQGEYLVQAQRQALYLCASQGDSELAAAKLLVLDQMGFDPFNRKAGQRTVSLEGLDVRFTTQISEGEGYRALHQQVFAQQPEGVFSVFQGGCTDGVYAYYIMNNQTHHPYTSYVYKVDTRTWTVVDRSQELALDHANSLGYNKVRNQLVVSNYEPNHTTLTLVDPDTLEITQRVTVDFNALSVAHNASRDQYVFGLSGTYNFVITDGDFNVLSYHEGPNTGNIKQEVDCDDNFIYFFQSGENHIVVHDWEGRYVTDVQVGMYIEAENLINIDGTFYTGYFTSGGLVYETILYKELS